jgi:hypothetical protein
MWICYVSVGVWKWNALFYFPQYRLYTSTTVFKLLKNQSVNKSLVLNSSKTWHNVVFVTRYLSAFRHCSLSFMQGWLWLLQTKAPFFARVYLLWQSYEYIFPLTRKYWRPGKMWRHTPFLLWRCVVLTSPSNETLMDMDGFVHCKNNYGRLVTRIKWPTRRRVALRVRERYKFRRYPR